jgi:mono/diheme cytochrome c family protein
MGPWFAAGDDRRTFLAAMLLLASVLLAFAGCGDTPDASTPTAGPPASRDRQPFVVTPVSGPSVIARLGLSLSETRFGQNGGTDGPPETARTEPPLTEQAPGASPMGGMMREFFTRLRNHQETSEILARPFVITGGDLYRLSCQSCHGPHGAGSPPEIPSYLDAVRGSSPTLIRQRIEARGQPADEAFVKELAAEGDRDLRNRLLKGGQKMPPFPHLEGAEVTALLHYLKQQAGVPEATAGQQTVSESIARVGEHLVKGTCHICHDATGPGSGHMMMMRGVIPSLASFPEEKSPDDLIRKVRYGASTTMGMMMGGARMPIFPYLTDEEVVAAYLYLEAYPPKS